MYARVPAALEAFDFGSLNRPHLQQQARQFAADPSLSYHNRQSQAGKDDVRQGQHLRVPRTRLKGKKPFSASILVQKYLRPAAVKAGLLREGQKIRFGFHNFRHSLASALVKMKVDPKTVQEFLRQAHVTTTLQLYAQSDMETKRDAQGKFLEQMLGDKIHLLTERVQ